MESGWGGDTGRSHGACLEFGFSVLPPRVSLYSRPGLRFAPSGLRGDAGLRNGGSVARMKCNGIRVGATPVAPMARASNSDFLYSRLGFRCTPDPDSASLPPGYVAMRGYATAVLCPAEMQWDPGGGKTGRCHGACLGFGYSGVPPPGSACSLPERRRAGARL